MHRCSEKNLLMILSHCKEHIACLWNTSTESQLLKATCVSLSKIFLTGMILIEHCWRVMVMNRNDTLDLCLKTVTFVHCSLCRYYYLSQYHKPLIRWLLSYQVPSKKRHASKAGINWRFASGYLANTIKVVIYPGQSLCCV